MHNLIKLHTHKQPLLFLTLKYFQPMSKQYIAIYDNQKLISDFFQNNLERMHQYDVLFSVSSEDKLFEYLTHEVKLLLFHATGKKEKTILLINSLLEKYEGLKILVYSGEIEVFENIPGMFGEKVKLISTRKGFSSFFEALKELLPDHKNHFDYKNEVLEIHEYYSEGFEKIRNSRKKILILKCIEDGMKPKQMDGMDGLKLNSVNTYIERMMEETGCKNQTELVIQAKKRGII